MAYQTSGYGGFIMEAKRRYVNPDLLFNTMDLNKNQITSDFLVNPKAQIQEGNNAIGDCGEIPDSCVDGEQLSVTADHKISVNNIFNDCSYEDLDPNVAVSFSNSVAQEWAKSEVRYAYSQLLPLFNDVTANADVSGAVNVKQQIIEVIKLATAAGYDSNDLVIAVSTSTYYDLVNLDVQCCDLGVQQQNTTATMSNKLKIGNVYVVNTTDLSGGLNTDPTNTVKFVVYVKEYAKFKVYCEKLPRLRSLTDKGHVESTQLIGKEQVGASYVQGDVAVDSAYVVYEEAPAPASDSLKAKNKSTK